MEYLNYELLIKLSLSLFFGLIIGIDRQIKHKPLGLKTSMVICVASCLVTIVSVEAYIRYATEGINNIDPMRLAAQIISGVGFLGAGVILRRSNDVISGLTTAAMIWAASGLGIAIGAGFFIEAFYSVLLILFAVNIIPYLLKMIGPSSLSQQDVAVRIVMEPNQQMTELLEAIERKGKTQKEKKHSNMTIRKLKLKDLDNGNQQIDLTLSVPEKQYTTEIYYLIKKIEFVLTVDVEHL
ncbi:MgtC/SapB family protein [Bacillus solitudinis]|uniref:MgtC/SapB family protein n=1 Tax=Bacillus solitudinis TaxID=2014074 RepID=UPI000C240C01|nr:MgtC/SapB family protein [Bacillus solitudinis]